MNKVVPLLRGVWLRSKEAGVVVAAGIREVRWEGVTDSRFSLSDQTFFAKRLAFLINAGIPIVDCLEMLREQTRSRAHRAMLEDIILAVSNGQSLARTFGAFPKVFGDFAVHIIRVGESSGTLSQNLVYLANELRKRQELKRKVIGAFVYPAIVSLATLGITIFLIVYLFPKIMPIFESLHADLPFTTRVVMGVSVFVRDYGIIAGACIFALIVAYVVGMRLSFGFRFFIHRSYMRIPLFGNVIRYYNVASTSRTLGLLLRSGLRLSEALPITAETTANLAYRAEFEKLAEIVVRGEVMSSYIRTQRKLFPDIFGNMIAVGEKSGTLSETLVYLSELYEAEVEDFTKNLSTLVEPALMIVMGVIVGFIAISIITPIYGITQSLHA